MEDPFAAEALFEKESREARDADARARRARATRNFNAKRRGRPIPAVPLPEEVDAARETREAAEARATMARLRERWEALERFVGQLEDRIGVEPAAAGKDALAEAEAIERVARRLEEFRRSAKFAVYPSGVVRPASPVARWKLLREEDGGGALLLAAAAVTIAAVAAGGGGPGLLWIAASESSEEKEREALARRRRRIQRRTQSFRQKKAVVEMAAKIDRALPAKGTAVAEVREAFHSLAGNSGESSLIDGAAFALAVRLGALRRDHLVARARALLAGGVVPS